MRRLSWRFIVSTLLLLTLSRLGLSFWMWDRVQAAGGLGLLMWGGLRIDLCLLAMVSGLPLFLSPWVGHGQIATHLTAYWFRFCWMLYVLLEVSTPQFIAEYDLRPNRLYFEYLTHPREVGAMLWHGYKGVLFVAFLLLIGAAWLSIRLFPIYLKDQRMVIWKRPLASFVLLAAAVLVGRGTLEHRPLNPSSVAFSSDALINALALNSLYSVFDAAYQFRNERSAVAFYGDLSLAEMNRIVRKEAGLEGPMLDANYPSLHRQLATRHYKRPLNLVIILQESLGAQFVGSLGGRNLTPNLDQLSQQGWTFHRAYATGTRSVRGLEAVVAGFLPNPSESVLKLPRSQTGFFTLARLLGQQGYQSRFIYGGEAHFDNMRSFFLNNGFNQVIDRKSFIDPIFVGSWGACDEDMFKQLDRVLRTHSDQSTFTLAFSVSNHSPWEYPTGRIQPQGDPATAENTVKYADWAIGKFFDQAKQAPYWKNTVFLVIADHDARVSGPSLVPVTHFHIPAVILGGTIEPREDHRIVSQIDMAPTLLSLIGVDSIHPMLGADLTQRDPNRAVMQFDNNFGYLKGNDLIILEPHKAARQYRYTMAAKQTPDQFDDVTVDNQFMQEALAHVLWPNWAYLHERYKIIYGDNR